MLGMPRDLANILKACLVKMISKDTHLVFSESFGHGRVDSLMTDNIFKWTGYKIYPQKRLNHFDIFHVSVNSYRKEPVANL